MTKAFKLARDLADDIHRLRISSRSFLGSTSEPEAHLHTLRKSAAELVQALGNRESADKLQAASRNLDEAVNIAGVTGLMGDSELVSAQAKLDSIWQALESDPPD